MPSDCISIPEKLIKNVLSFLSAYVNVNTLEVYRAHFKHSKYLKREIIYSIFKEIMNLETTSERLESLQNKDIKNDLDAWLTFLSTDMSEWIERLIRNHPEFIPMYIDIYELCRNTEKVMELYSKELSLLDKNTVQLMIDEMRDTIDGQKSTINKHESTITQLQGTIDEQKQEIEELRRQLENQIANSR